MLSIEILVNLYSHWFLMKDYS